MNGPPAPAARRYRFADLTLDVGQCRVRRGDDVIPLSKLSFDLLRVLVENAPNVVPHEQLASEAWGPRRVVTAENLAKRVMLLRQALDDRAADSRYIEAIRGHGYRLIPDVRPDGPEASIGGAGASEPADARRITVTASAATLGEPVTEPANSSEPRAGAGTAPAERPHGRSRRDVLVGALGVAVAALAIDDYRLRRARQAEARTAAIEPAHVFELYAPQSTSFGASPGDPQPALAPGARALAFVAPLQSTDVIWVQPIGSLEARPLRGTDRAAWPFWSADGRSIAFGREAHIHRVAAAGNAAPVAVAELRGPYWGGAWAGDDTLLYGGPEGLYRVPASGGEAVRWTEPDASAGEFSHRFPVLLPDGRRFVYFALSAERDREGFYIGSLDDRGMKRWLRAGHSQAALASGRDGRLHLIFVGEHGEVLAQPFDGSHTKLVGDAVEVAPANTVEINGSVRAAALAARDRVLVYRPRIADRTRLVWRDRTGAPDETVALPEGAYRHLALSHDGSMLAVERDALDERSGLWVIDWRRKQYRRLGVGQMSAWTPDDSRLVYSHVRPDGWRVDMKTVAADGEAEPLVTGAHPFVKRIREVTRNALLFQCEIAGQSWLYYWPLGNEESPRILPLTPPRASHARLSPDERWLAFSATDAGETHVYVTSFPDLAQTVRISTFEGTDPQWRSDGRELYYVTLSRTLMAVDVTTGDTLEFGSPVPLFHVPLDPRSLELSSAYAPAPDGQRFIVAEVADQDVPRLHVRLNWA